MPSPTSPTTAIISESPRRSRNRFARGLIITLVLFAWCGVSLGQAGPLIAELVEYPEVRRVIPADTAATFSTSLSLTRDQQAAAADLISAARSDLARVVNTHMRTVRDDASFEQMKSSEARVLKDALSVEQRMFNDLRALLTPDQAGAFGAFERAHRRSLLRGRTDLLLGVDVFDFLRRNSFDRAANADLDAALSRFEMDLDSALVRERRGRLAYFALVREPYDASPEAQERMNKTQGELYASSANLRRVQASMLQRILPALPQPLADALVLQSMELLAAGFDRTAASPDRYPVVREIDALDLPEAQKAQVRARVEAAKAEVLELCRICLRDSAAFELMDNAARSKVPTAPVNVFWDKASKLRARVRDDLLALLTPDQRSRYDASPVLDPSESSTVNDPP